MQRKYWIGLGIFGVLLLYAVLTQTGNRGFNTLRLPVLTKIEVDQMNKIEIDRSADKLILGRMDKAWRIMEPINFPADSFRLDNARRILSEARVTDIITERPENEADFGLNSGAALHVTVKSLKDKTVELWVGKLNAAGTHTFVRLPGRTGVFQVLGDLTTPLSVAAPEWRSKKIFDQSPDEALSASIAQGGKTLAFSKSQEAQPAIVGETPKGVTPPALPARTVWKAEGQAQPLAEDKVSQWLNSLTRLSATNIVDDPAPAAKPLAVVGFKTAQGEQALEILAHDAKTKRYRVRRTGDATVYEIEDYQGRNLLKTYADLK